MCRPVYRALVPTAVLTTPPRSLGPYCYRFASWLAWLAGKAGATGISGRYTARGEAICEARAPDVAASSLGTGPLRESERLDEQGIQRGRYGDHARAASAGPLDDGVVDLHRQDIFQPYGTCSSSSSARRWRDHDNVRVFTHRQAVGLPRACVALNPRNEVLCHRVMVDTGVSQLISAAATSTHRHARHAVGILCRRTHDDQREGAVLSRVAVGV